MALDEQAVAQPEGRVRDLTLIDLPAPGGMAVGWRQSAAPNDADARAAFLLLGAQGAPRGEVLLDANPSTEGSALVATQTTILRVLAEHDGENDSWGLVVVVRDPETGELLPDGYRTLPIFAGATLTDLRLAPVPSKGAILAWVERAGPAADLVQLVALDDEGTPLGPPLALAELPTDVVRLDLVANGDSGALLAALARRGASAQVWVVLISVDEALRMEVQVRQLTANVSDEDRVLDLGRGGDCIELLLTQGGAPARGTIRLDNPLATQFERLHGEGEDPGVLPRLLDGPDASVLYVYDRPDGSSRVRAIEHGNACRARVGGERRFPLSRHRCTELATLPGDPLPYACATACLTKGCGDEWIYVGDASF